MVAVAVWGIARRLFAQPARCASTCDVEPFAPLLLGDSLFLDLHAEVSILCAVVLTYYLAQWVQFDASPELCSA